MPLPRADLESLLRARRLDRTLTTTMAGPSDAAVASTGFPVLDARLGGGFPRGQLSEIVGARSSGRMSLLLQMAAQATARGELVAFVDALDMLDVGSAAAAGVDLARFLWIRGHVVASPGACRDMNQRAMEQAVRALALVLQSGSFGLVAFDVAEAPREALRRLPFTTWLRLQRMVEGAETVCVLVGTEQVARSAAGLTLRVGREGSRDSGLGIREDSGFGIRRIRFGRLFEGLDINVRVVGAHAGKEATVALATVASNHV